MGNCLSNENSINGRTKARKSKADQRGAKIRLKRSKRRQSLENLSSLDNPVDEHLASSAYTTTATTKTATTTTTPNPLGSRAEVVATEASSNNPQQQGEDCFILGVGLGEQVQVERLQRKRKGGAPMVSCKPPSSTGAAPSSNAQSFNGETNEADEVLKNESHSLFLSDTLETDVDCPTAKIFSPNASISNGFTPPAILILITGWLSGLGDNDFFFGIDPSPMPDLEVGGRAAAARPQVLSERTLALHTKSLALMKSVYSLPGSPAGAKQRNSSVARAESEDEYGAGSSTDDFSSLENERLSWLEVSQEDLNTFTDRVAVPTPSSKSERSNKSPSTSASLRPPGNQTPRKSSLLAAFHARRRTEGVSQQPHRATQ